MNNYLEELYSPKEYTGLLRSVINNKLEDQLRAVVDQQQQEEEERYFEEVNNNV